MLKMCGNSIFELPFYIIEKYLTMVYKDFFNPLYSLKYNFHFFFL